MDRSHLTRVARNDHIHIELHHLNEPARIPALLRSSGALLVRLRQRRDKHKPVQKDTHAKPYSRMQEKHTSTLRQTWRQKRDPV